MNFLSAYFKFHKAGQGAFYGGRINNGRDDKAWTIINDCGTKGSSTTLNMEIDNFKIVNGHAIDILFISHLDYEHVLGGKQLLKNFK